MRRRKQLDRIATKGMKVYGGTAGFAYQRLKNLFEEVADSVGYPLLIPVRYAILKDYND